VRVIGRIVFAGALATLSAALPGPVSGQAGPLGQAPSGQAAPGQTSPGVLPGQPVPGQRPNVYGTTRIQPDEPLPPEPIRPALSTEQLARAAQRRARVVGRSGDAAVLVGEVEDYLATAPPGEVQAFRAGPGRRAVVERLLRRHLLALEAERRGSVVGALRHRARRQEERALRDLLESEVRRDPGSLPPPSAPVLVPQRRFAVVLRTGSRAVAERWARENRDTPFHQALAHATEVGEAQETPYGTREEPPTTSPPIEPAVWEALFALERTGQVSRPVSLGGGRFAAVLHAGSDGGYTNSGPDDSARRMAAGDRAWTELVAQVQEDRVAALDLAAVDGVPFRSVSRRSPEELEALAAQIEEERRAAEMAGGEPVGEEGAP
jgi:hypothetical protein